MTNTRKNSRIFYHKRTGDPVQLVAKARTKPVYQSVICYQELKEPFEYYVVSELQFYEDYVKEFDQLELKENKLIEKRPDLPDKIKKIEEKDVIILEDKNSESNSDPRIRLLNKFFDAKTYKEKLNIFKDMQEKLDEFMLNNIAVSLDLPVDDKVDMIQLIMSELELKAKYEIQK